MKNILLACNPYRDNNFEMTRRVFSILKEQGLSVEAALTFEVREPPVLPSDLPFVTLERAMHRADLLIALGGDGTILHLAPSAARHGLPILGVNMGNKGFMADLERDEADLLRDFAKSRVRYDWRMMLDASVLRRGKNVYFATALNDAVISWGAAVRAVRISVVSDGSEVLRFSGDGVIVATPTGSTAYSMSAGGPIVEPEAENLIITPICPHNLAAGSRVLSGGREVEIAAGDGLQLHTDGNEPFILENGDVVKIKRSVCKTCLARLKNTSFFKNIEEKLSI